MHFDSELNATGLSCPLPILRAKKAITDLDSGKVMKIIATDPGSVKDFDAFCRTTGHELVEREEAQGQYVFYIRKH
jgi:tRNA 2-thiouridine synthesizing protein A